MDSVKYYLSLWYIRLITFLVTLIILAIALSFIPFRYDTLSSSQELNKLLAYLFNFIIILIPLFIIEKSVGISLLKSYGVSNFHKFPKYLFTSFLVVLFSFSIILTANFLLNNFALNINNFQIEFALLINILVIFILAFQEELIFRAFLINSLELRFTTVSSVVISGVIFALLHIFNSNYSTLSAVNTFLAGLLLGLMYVQSRSIWLPTLFHFFWNLFQPILLNSAISGKEFNMNLFSINQEKFFNILNGGSYGLENTIAATLIIILSFIYFSKIETLNPYNSSNKYKVRYKLDNYLLKNEQAKKNKL